MQNCPAVNQNEWSLTMKELIRIVLPSLAVAAILCQDTIAATPEENAKMTQAEAKMFTVSSGYERYMGRWSRILAPLYIGFASVKDGERVLDVGAGTGALTSALETATTSSELVGIDPSEGFINYAKKNAKSGRVRFEVGDAQKLPYGDASFDQTMSQFVINFVPDHEKAVAEMRRVTRAGGVVSSCVWDYGGGMESLRIFWDEAVALQPAAEPKHERNMKLTRKGELAQLWKKAGLVRVQEKALVIEQAFSSFDDYWAPFLSGTGPGGAYVVSLPAEQRAQLEARMRSRLLHQGADTHFSLKARAWCVRAEVPR
jgi:SAM-dependent methyltransferase